MIEYSQFTNEINTIVRDIALDLQGGESISSVVVSHTATVLSSMGDATTQFTVTNTSGNTFRYTYTGAGADPKISSLTPVGNEAVVSGISINNCGAFLITASGTNYFEVTNPSGAPQSAFLLGSLGSINIDTFGVTTSVLGSTQHSSKILGGVAGTAYGITVLSTTSTGDIINDQFSVLVR